MNIRNREPFERILTRYTSMRISILLSVLHITSLEEEVCSDKSYIY